MRLSVSNNSALDEQRRAQVHRRPSRARNFGALTKRGCPRTSDCLSVSIVTEPRRLNRWTTETELGGAQSSRTLETVWFYDFNSDVLIELVVCDDALEDVAKSPEETWPLCSPTNKKFVVHDPVRGGLSDNVALLGGGLSCRYLGQWSWSFSRECV